MASLKLMISAIGICGIAYTIYSMKRSLDARNWPTTSGTVLRSRVGKHFGGDGSTYSVEIAYSYKVNQVDYSSEKYAFGLIAISGLFVWLLSHNIIKRMPEGSTVKVSYDPQAPGTAVLSTGILLNHIVQTVIFGIFVAIGVAM